LGINKDKKIRVKEHINYDEEDVKNLFTTCLKRQNILGNLA